MLDTKLIEGIILICFSFLRWKSFWVLCDWTEDCRQQNVSRSFHLRVLVAWFHTKVFIGVTFLNQFRFKENNLFFVYIFYLIFRIPCKTLCSPPFTPFLPPLPSSVLSPRCSLTPGSLEVDVLRTSEVTESLLGKAQPSFFPVVILSRQTCFHCCLTSLVLHREGVHTCKSAQLLHAERRSLGNP